MRGWERYQFSIDYEHQQVVKTHHKYKQCRNFGAEYDKVLYLHIQHKAVLQRKIPDRLKISIAKRIENNLFSKVGIVLTLKF